MKNVKRWLQVTLYIATLLSCTLLGLAMESYRMIAIGVVGSTLGFVMTDIMKMFSLQGLIANLASIGILVFAMKDFFSLDGTGQLTCVANLLVYLLTVLMFQEKTPRLNWQVMVLTLLQTVVSAIFSLDLEGGLMLFIYFLVVGFAMYLQSVYTQQHEIDESNRNSASRFDNLTDANQGRSTEPTTIAFFKHTQAKPMRLSSVSIQLAGFATAAFAFTLVLFYLAPRHATPWYGPMSSKVTTAGVSKSVDLDERGMIDLSAQLMFRVRFRKPDGSDLNLFGTPYFRGLALSDLVIRNGKTDWRAPQDRISFEHYQKIPDIDSLDRAGNVVFQQFFMEETNDPLIYGVFPFFGSQKTPKKMRFCHEVSGLTRCELNGQISLAPFKYEGATIIDPRGRFAMAWPYVSNTGPYLQRPMSDDPPQMEWLTKMDPDRYPTLCNISDQLAKKNRDQGGNVLSLMRTMEDYLQDGRRFRYTLDFRKIKRNESLDPIEDFVRNHRSGHCELYASALTLMLRHQGIPARLVVGFRGGSYNSLTNSYLVRANNAHAWVEAYLPPEACSNEMYQNNQAGPGGAWMILEATPFATTAGEEVDDSLDIARSVWDDFVLGHENDEASSQQATSLYSSLQFIDVESFERRIKSVTSSVQQPWVKIGVPIFLFCVALIAIIRKSMSDPDPNPASKKVGFFRRVVANAISLISPSWSEWVMGKRAGISVDFYDRLSRLLAGHQLQRKPNQTHREFAEFAANSFSGRPNFPSIRDHIDAITDAFNRVRFGNEKLDASAEQTLSNHLRELEQWLAVPDADPVS